MRFIAIISMVLGVTLAVSAQNQLDDQGRKSGRWKVDHPNGRTWYEADFFEGRPVGEMIRYYENGAVSARMMFDTSGVRSHARMYFQSGKIAAEGWYVNQQKDSVWTYYSPVDGSVRFREPYEDGHLHGKVLKYYPDGQISEEVTWMMGQKQGAWKQYYPSAALRLSAFYEKDVLHGSYRVYFSNGKPEISGELLNGKSHGVWSYFDETGKELMSFEFVHGIPVDREKYDQWIQDTLEKYQVPLEPEPFQNFQ